eukprot:scaffold20356_cov125-Isochrysis_galbana.AAC.17
MRVRGGRAPTSGEHKAQRLLRSTALPTRRRAPATRTATRATWREGGGAKFSGGVAPRHRRLTAHGWPTAATWSERWCLRACMSRRALPMVRGQLDMRKRIKGNFVSNETAEADRAHGS